MIGLVVMYACGGRPVAPVAPVPLVDDGVALDLELLKRPDAPSGIPLVRAAIGDRELWMVVDLGAGSSVLDERLATTLGLAAEGSIGAAGSGGTVTEATRHDGVTLSLGTLGTYEQTLFSIPFPESLSSRGIEGILSPQQLLTDGGAFVLDLPERRMRRVASLPGATEPRLAPGERCISNDGRHIEYSVMAEVHGEPVRLMIDTGATRGSLFATPERVARLEGLVASEEEVDGAGGVVGVKRLRPLPVRSGGVEAELVFDLEAVGPGVGCDSDGSLGMDLLHRCIVQVDATALAATCSGHSTPSR